MIMLQIYIFYCEKSVIYINFRIIADIIQDNILNAFTVSKPKLVFKYAPAKPHKHPQNKPPAFAFCLKQPCS